MNRSQDALGTLRTKAQFELSEVAAEVAKASAWTAQLEDRAVTAGHRCNELARQLRDSMGRSKINPALICAMHGLHRNAHAALCESQTQLTTAREREEEVRRALAALRNTERSLERALQAGRRKQKLQQQAREIVIADDLWLQHISRQSP